MVGLMTIPVLSEQSVKHNISDSELSQRVVLIKRFRELLKAQRDRFQEYLNTLDRQKEVIEKGTADELLRHVELEEKIVEDIFSIQKVLDPLELMYNSSKKKTMDKTEDEVSGLRDVLDGLKTEAINLSERNRVLLGRRMAEIRTEIESFKVSAYTRRNFERSNTPTLIDIKG